MSNSPTMSLSYLHFFVIYLKKISRDSARAKGPKDGQLLRTNFQLDFLGKL